MDWRWSREAVNNLKYDAQGSDVKEIVFSTEKDYEKIAHMISDSKLVQIKITQSNNIILCECSDYILILYLDRTNGEVTEIYNGTGSRV